MTTDENTGRDADPQAADAAPETSAGGGRRGLLVRLLFILPVLVFAVIAGYFLWGLQPGRDPRLVPSALVGKPLPQFQLPAIQGSGGDGLTTAELTRHGEPVLLNVFASWCVPCRAEHPILMRLADERGVPIYGINYKDKAADARQWLSNHGDPYTDIGAMSERRAEVGIELGVYGVPETYVVGPDGIIRYKHVGPIHGKALREKILPLLNDLKG